MIKQAELQEAYLLGRQAAFEKLAKKSKKKDDEPYAGTALLKGLSADQLKKQDEIRNLIGLGGKGLTVKDLDTNSTDYSVLDASNYATPENLARLSILTGALGGSYLDGGGLANLSLSTAGALGGGQLGGNLGALAAAATNAYRGDQHGPLPDEERERLISTMGAIGGLGGGLLL